MPSRYHTILEKEQRWKRRLYRLIPTYRFSNDIYEDAIKARLKEGIRWVDLGCGKNGLIHELGGAGAEAYGLDCFTHSEIQRYSPTRFIQADVNALPFANACLDLVSNNVLMEHLLDPGRALKEMYRTLKPGGYLIFRTPNALHLLNLLLRLTPEGLKRKMIASVFGVSPQDVFPTYYRANRLKVLGKLCREAGFGDVQITAVEDVHAAFGFFFVLSLFYYAIVCLKPLTFLRTNFVVVAQKDTPSKNGQNST